MTEWAKRMEEARRIERAAKDAFTEAFFLRCTSVEPGGGRCTADAEPVHAHRYDTSDLPKYAR